MSRNQLPRGLTRCARCLNITGHVNTAGLCLCCEVNLGQPTDRYIVASADRCTVHPQHVMVNQGRDESLYADLYVCECGKTAIGNTDESKARRPA